MMGQKKSKLKKNLVVQANQVSVSPLLEKAPSMKKKKVPKKRAGVPVLVNPNSSGMNGACSNISRGVVDFMNSSEVISEEGKGLLGVILNPCGEHHDKTNAQFIDGTLTQSGVERLRLFETLTPPFLSLGSNDNVNRNWTLMIISAPFYKTFGLILAVDNNLQPTDAQLKDLFGQINADLSNPIWPSWKTAPNEHIFYTFLQFDSADLNVDDSTGASKDVESFRMTGDGFVLFHNTPDLWNQGSVVVGQFQSDITSQSGSGLFNMDMSAFYNNLTPPVTSQWSMVGPVLAAFPPTIVTSGTPQVIGTGVPAIPFVLKLPDGTVFYDNTLPTQSITVSNSGPLYTVTGNTTPPVSFFNNNISTNPDSPTLFNFSVWLSTDGQLAPYASPEVLNQVLWHLPPLSQAQVVQADPKYSAELMKDHLGVYVVRRYFEPKLRMTPSTAGGNVKFEVNGMGRSEVLAGGGGLMNDLIDSNAAVIVTIVRGISYAANPTIKANRFLEYMPAPGSRIAQFVSDCPPKDEDAEEVFRQMQVNGPHSYIPDANLLGLLSSFITTLVENLPVFLRGARSISSAVVKGLDWVEENLYPATKSQAAFK